MCNSAAHNARPNRESLSKRLGYIAKQIKARDGFACIYCRRDERASGAPLQLDHLTPKSLGGLDVAANLALCCRRCNSARQNMTLGAWSAHAAAKLGLVFTATAIRGQARRALPDLRRAAQ